MVARPSGMVKYHKLGHIFANLFINIFSALESQSDFWVNKSVLGLEFIRLIQFHISPTEIFNKLIFVSYSVQATVTN